MRILVAHEINYESKVIYEIQEFPEMLAALGHQITFLQFEEGANRKHKMKARDRIIGGRVYKESKIRLITPHRFGIESIDRIWTTISSWIAIFKLMRREKFDIVVNYAVPTFGVQLLVLSKLFHVPFVHRALDASHVIIESKWKPFILITEKLIYRFADFLSANNPAMKEYCVRLGKRSKFSEVHYPPLDLDYFKNASFDEKLAESLGIAEGENVITYMGSFFYFSGLDTVIRDFAERRSEIPSTKLLLIGSGEQDTLLRNIVEQYELQNFVIFTGSVPFAELPKYLALSTVAINAMEPKLVSNVAFPHKVIQYMASGIPTVTTRLDGLFQVFSDKSAITWVDRPAKVMSAALGLLVDKRNLKVISDSQREELSRFLPSRALTEFESFLVASAK